MPPFGGTSASVASCGRSGSCPSTWTRVSGRLGGAGEGSRRAKGGAPGGARGDGPERRADLAQGLP
eukprot:8930392-Alexandrium_andersonii.AAC.1